MYLCTVHIRVFEFSRHSTEELRDDFKTPIESDKENNDETVAEDGAKVKQLEVEIESLQVFIKYTSNKNCIKSNYRLNL